MQHAVILSEQVSFRKRLRGKTLRVEVNINPLALELDIYSLAHHLFKM